MINLSGSVSGRDSKRKLPWYERTAVLSETGKQCSKSSVRIREPNLKYFSYRISRQINYASSRPTSKSTSDVMQIQVSLQHSVCPPDILTASLERLAKYLDVRRLKLEWQTHSSPPCSCVCDWIRWEADKVPHTN